MIDVKTIGERRIRTDFASNAVVSDIKNLYADLYNSVIGLISWREATEEDKEEVRLLTESLRLLETSSMYAVKGLTTRLS